MKASNVKIFELVVEDQGTYIIFPDGDHSCRFGTKEIGLYIIDYAFDHHKITEDEALILRGMIVRSSLPTIEEATAHFENEVFDFSKCNLSHMGPSDSDSIH